MNENQNYIELFTALIKHIDGKNQNSEFSTELINHLQKSGNIPFPELNSNYA